MIPINEVEIERCDEQGRLDSVKGSEERNRLGQFATPNPLAVAIARYMIQLRRDQLDPVRFLDPSIGTGSFYSALRQVTPPGIIVQATGIEVDPRFAEAASRLWGPHGLDVRLGDFTRLDPPLPGQRANLILANPPYVRHHHLDRSEKRRLQNKVAQQVGIDVSGLAGLYTHFLILCDSWLEHGGLAAWLIPSEFMDVNYGSAIKDYLTSRVRLRHIHRFSPNDIQFGDALVTSAVVVFEKASPDETNPVKFSFGGSLEEPELIEPLSLADLRESRKWTNYPRSVVPKLQISAASTTLGDLFSIRRGLVTGSNDFFILSRDEALKKGLPIQFLRPILPSPRYIDDPIIEADSEGFPVITPPLVLLDCECSEDEARRQHPELWKYLQEGVSQRLHEGYLTSRRTPWFSQERREPPPFVCTYMGRRSGERSPFRIFWNKSRAVAANVYLLLYPKGPLQRAFVARPELYATVFGLLQDIRPASFVEEGRVYGGGLHKMEPKELAMLPADAILRAIGHISTQRQVTFAGF